MNLEEYTKSKRTAWAALILCPLSMAVMFALVTLEMVPGLDAGHPVEYLQATCFLWGLIMMVLPILRLLRLVSLPAWVNIIVYSNMYLYVISLCCGLYLNISWWGDFTHVLSSMIVTMFVFVALCLMESHSPPHATFGTKGGLLIMLFLIGMSFGGIWEMMEGFTDAITGTSYMVYGASDTLADLAADFVGVVFMTIIAYFILKRQNAKEIASRIKFGRSAFKISE